MTPGTRRVAGRKLVPVSPVRPLVWLTEDAACTEALAPGRVPRKDWPTRGVLGGTSEVILGSGYQVLFAEPSFNDFVTWLSGTAPDPDLLAHLKQERKKEYEQCWEKGE